MATSSSSKASDEAVEIHRSTLDWKPVKDLCKRFNVCEPLNVAPNEPKRSQRFGAFMESSKIFLAAQKKDNLQLQTLPNKNEPSFSGSTTSKANDVPSFSKTTEEKNEKDTELPEIEAAEIKVIKVAELKTKKDLFKSIFCNSSDENEDSKDSEDDSTEMSGTASKDNSKLEWTLKEFFEPSFIQPRHQPTSDKKVDEQQFGPKLPNLPETPSTSLSDVEIIQQKSKQTKQCIVEEWVEKKKHKKKKLKAKDKHKKSKHKKKKHKSSK